MKTHLPDRDIPAPADTEQDIIADPETEALWQEIQAAWDARSRHVEESLASHAQQYPLQINFANSRSTQRRVEGWISVASHCQPLPMRLLCPLLPPHRRPPLAHTFQLLVNRQCRHCHRLFPSNPPQQCHAFYKLAAFLPLQNLYRLPDAGSRPCHVVMHPCGRRLHDDTDWPFRACGSGGSHRHRSRPAARINHVLQQPQTTTLS